MYTTTMASYKPFQKLHPLTLLAQLSSRQTNGCLQVSDGSTTWLIYLEHGKLIYATNSANPFERLDRHLRTLSQRLPHLVSAIRVQVRLLFDRGADSAAGTTPADYKAICWLVDQRHLSPDQAGQLVESLAKEVIESFLSVQDGMQDLIPPEKIGEVPQFCQLDLRLLVEQCQTQLQRRQMPFLSHRTGERTNERIGERLAQKLDQNGASPHPAASEDKKNKPETTANSSAANEPTKAQRLGSNNQSLPLPTGKTTYTIACIDDSPTVLQAIRTFLDDKTFTVLMIDNPVKALMQIIRSKPDLILLDVTMPNLDGYELCSLLRKHPSFKHTPVVMVTGNTGFIDRAKAKLVGASGYLTKPFTQSDLVKMVFKHLV
ncbi:MAG TPA: response regulator [Allocoleopsis sp.]